MTISNHTAVKKLNHNLVSTVFLINTMILLIAGLLMIYYVVQANIISAGNYKINLLNQKRESLNEVRSSLAAEKSSMEDPVRVVEYALSQNMVEAKNVAYIFENGNVAYEKP